MTLTCFEHLLYGKDADSHECSVGLEQSATVVRSPIEGAYHHASCLQSWAKRGGE